MPERITYLLPVRFENQACGKPCVYPQQLRVDLDKPEGQQIICSPRCPVHPDHPKIRQQALDEMEEITPSG
jgi:hypothetical protein